jgi:hypothetical protein
MIKFYELMALADKCREATGDSVSIEIEYWSSLSFDCKTNYKLWLTRDHKLTHFKTVGELITAMNNIITPSKDEGISLEE